MTDGPARLAIDAFPGEVRAVLRLVDAVLPSPAAAWVVGGAVRDALMGRAARDVDVVVPAGALALGRSVADRLGWAFVPLDEDRDVCRVVGTSQIDIAGFRGPGLGADLAGRDFTVNALAAPLRELAKRGSAPVEDMTGGLADLAARRVRACAPGAFSDDPLRVMRVARLAVEPGWHVDPDTEVAARAAAPSLTSTSAERVRDELIALVGHARAGHGLRLLDRMGALAVLLPESGPMRVTPQTAPHRFDVWEHSLRAVEGVDEIERQLSRLEPWSGELREHLADELGDGLTRARALKLAALLHDVAKPQTRTELDGRVRFIGHDKLGAEQARAVAMRLRLSRRATDLLTRLVAQHLRPMHLAQAGGITRRARYRFFRDLGDDARDLLLLTLADAAAVRGDAPLEVWAGPAGEILRSLMAGMAEEARAAKDAPLLSGHDVMHALGIGPGPLVGRHLARLREAQALGAIRTRDAAVEYLRRSADDEALDTRDGGS